MGSAGVPPATQPLRDLFRGVLDAALPQTCVACGEWIVGGGRLACEQCHAAIAAAMARPYCPRCGRTLPRVSIHEKHCARCRTEHFWNVVAVARVATYLDVLRPVVLRLKYGGQERNAEYLGDLLAAAVRQGGWAGELDALVPVPMHWLRRGQRRCDHAQLLTEVLARRLKLPILRLVRRTRHSPSQTRMSSKSQRFENVRGCFGMPRRWRTSWWPWRPDVGGKTVCIVDNLIRTGATVCEVAKVLRRAGAKRIYAVAVARPAAPGDPRRE